MDFNLNDIFQLAGTIWQATLGLTIEPEQPDAIGSCGRATVACVQITGALNGAVFLSCPADFARRAASIMFNVAPASITVSELQDAIAELVNIVGGNVKGLLPDGCHLSLPQVVEGADYSARVPGSRMIGRVAFRCDSHAVSICILEKVETKTV